MVQAGALITDIGTSGPFVRVTLAATAIASGLAAGRFVLADLGGYLRAPLFPARIEAEEFDVLISPRHAAAALQPGADVDLIGPLGRGFEIPAATERLLLVASTDYLPVLLPLAYQNQQKPGSAASLREKPGFYADKPGFSIALLLSAPTAAELYPVRLLPPAVEVTIVTADGSAGQRGSILKRSDKRSDNLLPDLVRWADCACIAGDPATYPALAEIVREVRAGSGRRFAQALVVPPMACGVGACQGCAVSVARGTKLACTDGPVFDLLELR
jgi:dihydroorotate dehydrogenase electron transfer subunit